jgi:hypothetical protein
MPSLFHSRAALFEPLGVNQSFLELYARRPSVLIDRLLAAYALLQIRRLKWEWPHIILYTRPRLSARIRGVRPRDRGLARELAKLLGAQATGHLHPNISLSDKVVLILNPEDERALFAKKLYALSLRDCIKISSRA